MRRHLIDRLTDTDGFRVLLVVAAVLVIPVLGLGLLLTPIYLAAISQQPGEAIEAIAFAALSIGGAVGMAGWVRALAGSRKPERHNVTATLVCLFVGVATGLAITGYLIFEMLTGFQDSSSWTSSLSAAALVTFVAADTILVLAGVGWMQRLPRLYSERTDRAFDGIPVVLLLVALGLAFMAVLGHAAL